MRTKEDQVYALVSEAASKFRLPPQFQLTVDRTMDLGMVIVTLLARWPDIYHEGQMATTYNRIHVLDWLWLKDPHVAVEEFKLAVDSAIHTQWDHELHEWLTFDGKHLHEPHPGGFDGPLG